MVTPKQLGHLVLRVRDLERSEAFYRAAREVGVVANRLQDADDAPHVSDLRLNAEGESVHARAFNRRVELFLSR